MLFTIELKTIAFTKYDELHADKIWYKCWQSSEIQADTNLQLIQHVGTEIPQLNNKQKTFRFI